NVQSVAGAIAPNVWQHVVVTRTAATKTIQFYVNGVAKGSGSYTTVPAAGTRPVSIGRADAAIQYVNGTIGEVALYATALGAGQVAAHYALRTAVPSATTVTL